MNTSREEFEDNMGGMLCDYSLNVRGEYDDMTTFLCFVAYKNGYRQGSYDEQVAEINKIAIRLDYSLPSSLKGQAS